MITAYTLFSGSGGNCIYVSDGESEILIDAGKNAKTIERSLSTIGTSLDKAKAILVTHEHSDHIGALGVITKRYAIPVHITSQSFEKAIRDGAKIENAVRHDVRYEITVGKMNIRSFEIPHDSAKNVGYVIASHDGDTLGIATDMGTVTDEIRENLLGCHGVIIEANHDTDMLIYGKYPHYLKKRILSDRGHLSNRDCADLAVYLAKGGTEKFTLAHLSRENNTPEAAFFTVRSELDKKGFQNAEISVASQDFVVSATDTFYDIKV